MEYIKSTSNVDGIVSRPLRRKRSASNPKKTPETTIQTQSQNHENRKTVEVWFMLDHVMDIDTVNQHFTANFVYKFRWQLENLELKLYNDVVVKANDGLTYDDFFDKKRIYSVPYFTIANMKDELNSHTSRLRFEETKNGDVYCTGKTRVQGIMFEKFELHAFPFDTQELTICLIQLNDKYDIIPRTSSNKNKPATIARMSNRYIITAEWKVRNLCLHYSNFAEEEPNDVYIPCIYAQLEVSRTWQNYVYRILIIIGFINLSVNYCFMLPFDEIGDRIGHVFEILLTCVFFQFLVSEVVPKLHYMTFLDLYIAVSYLYILLAGSIVFWNGLRSKDIPQEFYIWNNSTGNITAQDFVDADNYATVTMILIWVVIQLFFCCYGWNLFDKETKKAFEFTASNFNHEYITWKCHNKTDQPEKQFIFKSEMYKNEEN